MQIHSTEPELRRVGPALVRVARRVAGAVPHAEGDPLFCEDAHRWAPALARCMHEVEHEIAALSAEELTLLPLHRVHPEHPGMPRIGLGSALLLYWHEQPSSTGAALCPRTASLLAAIPELHSAWIEFLAPHSATGSFAGIGQGLLQTYLPLRSGEENGFAINTGERLHVPRAGAFVAFEATTRRELSNRSDSAQAVLVIETYRPVRWPGRFVRRLELLVARRSRAFRAARAYQRAWEAACARRQARRCVREAVPPRRMAS